MLSMMMLISLSACAPACGNLTAADIKSLAPDVPKVSRAVQATAADEVQSGKCPALSNLASVCEVTRDEARNERGESVPK